MIEADYDERHMRIKKVKSIPKENCGKSGNVTHFQISPFYKYYVEIVTFAIDNFLKIY